MLKWAFVSLVFAVTTIPFGFSDLVPESRSAAQIAFFLLLLCSVLGLAIGVDRQLYSQPYVAGVDESKDVRKVSYWIMAFLAIIGICSLFVFTNFAPAARTTAVVSGAFFLLGLIFHIIFTSDIW